MIRSEHARDDFKVLATKIKEGTVTVSDVAKVVLTVGKILLSIRGNQIAMMKKLGIELQKPRTEKSETTKKE
jgi:hypothetical protein